MELGKEDVTSGGKSYTSRESALREEERGPQRVGFPETSFAMHRSGECNPERE